MLCKLTVKFRYNPVYLGEYSLVPFLFISLQTGHECRFAKLYLKLNLHFVVSDEETIVLNLHLSFDLISECWCQQCALFSYTIVVLMHGFGFVTFDNIKITKYLILTRNLINSIYGIPPPRISVFIFKNCLYPLELFKSFSHIAILDKLSWNFRV